MPKRVLISAGPTWVKLDAVRVISNISSGKTGLLLAREAQKRGYEVTLLLGPVEDSDIPHQISLKRFRYFNELFQSIQKELKNEKYDIVIHAAAVSDYRPQKAVGSKISSGRKSLVVRLRPTEKIVDRIKKIDPRVYLVLFKLEYGLTDSLLIGRAREVLLRAKADLAVANRLTPGYKSFIVDKDNIYARAASRPELAKKLFKVIRARLT